RQRSAERLVPAVAAWRGWGTLRAWLICARAGFCRPTARQPAGMLSSLVGRDQELAEVVARLDGTRLLTLTGVGGCGKTRLAIEAAQAIVPKYPDGVWLVELGRLSDPVLVAQEVGAVLGVRESPALSLTSALTQ